MSLIFINIKCLTFTQFISSIVNDGIGGVLYLLKKDPTSIKNTKIVSLYRRFYAHKKHKLLNKSFLHLRCFYLHKKHKALNKRFHKKHVSK